jgi:hypothetical protein
MGNELFTVGPDGSAYRSLAHHNRWAARNENPPSKVRIYGQHLALPAVLWKLPTRRVTFFTDNRDLLIVPCPKGIVFWERQKQLKTCISKMRGSLLPGLFDFVNETSQGIGFIRVVGCVADEATTPPLRPVLDPS